jgi:hypothetical protein
MARPGGKGDVTKKLREAACDRAAAIVSGVFADPAAEHKAA